MITKLMLLLLILTFTSFSQQFQLEWKTPTGKRAYYFGDLDGDKIGEFLIMDSAHVVRVYDGFTHNLKWTFTLDLSEWITARYGYGDEGVFIPHTPLLDFNGNGVKDLIVSGRKIIDPSTNALIHDFSIPNAYDTYVIGLDDVDNDNQLEILIGKENVEQGSILVYSTGLSVTSVVGNMARIESNYKLFPNYPNPFNPNTEIQYEVPKKSLVNITIYNSLGQIVKILINEEKDAGIHTIIWDGRDDSNKILASGPYFYRLKIDDFSQARKMIFLK